MANKRVCNITCAVLLTAAVVLGICFPALSTAESSILDRPVKFDSSGESGLDAILRFGSENKISMGLVFTSRLCATRISRLSIHTSSARKALPELAREVPSYIWRLEDNTVILAPNDMPAPMSTFLALSVPDYSIPEETLQAQVLYAWMDIRSSLRPNEGTALNILTSPTYAKWPSLTFSNLNVEQVLNHLIARKGGGVWILLPFDDIEKAGNKRPFWVTGYSDDPQGRAASCASIEAEVMK